MFDGLLPSHSLWPGPVDILPLCLVPSLVYGGIIYRLVGLVPTVPAFWKFMLTLVLFNLITVSVILLLSISFESTSVGAPLLCCSSKLLVPLDYPSIDNDPLH